MDSNEIWDFPSGLLLFSALDSQFCPSLSSSFFPAFLHLFSLQFLYLPSESFLCLCCTHWSCCDPMIFIAHLLPAGSGPAVIGCMMWMSQLRSQHDPFSSRSHQKMDQQQQKELEHALKSTLYMTAKEASAQTCTFHLSSSLITIGFLLVIQKC